MKKTSAFVILYIVFLAISCTSVYASSSATYFDGKAPIIEDPSNVIQILSNEITINTDTSKVTNELILKNTSAEEIITKIALPLENEELSTSIHDLVIVVNGVNVQYTEGNGGEYVFSTKIPAGMGKRIEVSFYTDNNLRDAKVVKYNFDNFKGKKIGRLRVDIILNEKDVPLVQDIYPGHYTYDQNIITVEYYDMDVNVITKDVIVTKETYKNLRYGRDYELTEYDKKILDDVDRLFEGDAFADYQNMDGITKRYFNFKEGEYYYGSVSEPCISIFDYVLYKEAIKREDYAVLTYNTKNRILLYETARKYANKIQIANSMERGYSIKDEDIKNLADKIICVEFVETIDNEELYVNKRAGSDEETHEHIYEPVLTSERKILKTEGVGQINRSLYERIIFIDEGINGEKLGATDEEKISYLNSINADLYIRVELYEGKILTYEEDPFSRDWGLGRIGYYRDTDKALATAFIHKDMGESNFDFSKEECDRALVKLTNEYIENNCEVPTLVQFLGYLKEEDGKTIVEYLGCSNYNDYERGLATAYNVIQTEEAQRQLKINKTNNANKRTQALKNLKFLKYVENEQAIQQELLALKQQEEQLQQPQENINNNNVKNNTADNQIIEEKQAKKVSLEIKDIIIFSVIGLAIVICIIILVLENKKKNKI